MRGFLLLIALLVCATSAGANDAHWLGHARLFTNDWLGDGQDRWRSGSYGVSLVRGREWNGRNPEHFGSLIEFRVRNEIIAPSNLADPVIGTDRPYAGILQFGVFSHLRRGKTDITLGLDLVATGPQTGIGFFQSSVHNFFGMDPVAILGSQIPNAIHPALSAAMARDFRLTHGDERRVVLRPFAEVEVGVENLVRVGGDLTFGDAGKGDFQVRDPSTGHRSTAIRGERRQGLSFLLGADVALVRSSRLLPASSGYRPVSPRTRIRAGYVFELKKGTVFYGLTWLGREFANQPQGQVVGSLTVRLDF